MTTIQTKPNGAELTRWAHLPARSPWNSHVSQLLESLWHTSFRSDTEPRAELTESEDAYVAEVELPGVDRTNVTVDVTDHRLSVHASRADSERTGALRHTTRTASSELDLEFELPTPVNRGAASATLTNGVLSVCLPKSDADTYTRVEIG